MRNHPHASTQATDRDAIRPPMVACRSCHASVSLYSACLSYHTVSKKSRLLPIWNGHRFLRHTQSRIRTSPVPHRQKECDPIMNDFISTSPMFASALEIPLLDRFQLGICTLETARQTRDLARLTCALITLHGVLAHPHSVLDSGMPVSPA